MKRLEQTTSHPYGYLIIDLKSGTPEIDRLHTEIFEKVNLTDKEMSVDERNDDDDDVDDESDDKPMMKSDLPLGSPGHRS